MQLSIKNLSIDTLIYGFGNVFTRLITFLLLPLYTNILTPSEYGIITIIYVFMGFMNIIYHYGLDSSFLKYYAKEKNIKNQKTIFSTAFFLNLFSSIILSFLIFLFSKQLSFLQEETKWNSLKKGNLGGIIDEKISPSNLKFLWKWMI